MSGTIHAHPPQPHCRFFVRRHRARLCPGARRQRSRFHPDRDLHPRRQEQGRWRRCFVTENKAAKAKYLSKALVALWAKADAHTPKGDVGPIDFDPVTNSQEPDVKSFKVDAEKSEADKATLAVTITGHRNDRKLTDQIVRYDFVREAGSWKVDDIKGSSDGEAWSIRKMLTDSLKG